MKKNTIVINKVEYPCRMTMGAMLEFNRRTGKEVTEIQGTDIALVVILVYCCLISSCRADGIDIPFENEMAMADHMSTEDLANWQSENFQSEVITGEPEIAVSKKKSNHLRTPGISCRMYRYEPDGFSTANPR